MISSTKSARVKIRLTMAEPGKPDAGSSFSYVLHQKRGIGYSSRFRVSDSLPPGWRLVSQATPLRRGVACETRWRREQKSSKYTVWYDDLGNRYKSSVEVERALKERNLLSEASEDETATETGGETSEYEASPVKRSRTSSL